MMAQDHDHRNCAAHEVLERQLQADPTLAVRMAAIEAQTERFIASGGATQQRAVITIPVVFNVVYKNATENISDARLLAQLDVLNKDFRKLNSDVSKVPAAFAALAADYEIQFCLAKQDPSGVATTGIRRIASTRTTGFGTNDAVKAASTGGVAPWDATKYLNLWICDIGGGILGYAQFPGGPTATDGVVLDYRYTGTTGSSAPYDLGRTATHEVGHWLNLRHIWGDANCGNDLVNDTPTQQTSNGGCPTFPKVTCSNGPNGDMFMNYMDYTNDACMFMFTTGQKARSMALFAAGGARASLLTSQGCNPPAVATCSVPTALTASGITTTGATLTWSGTSIATTYTVNYRVVGAATWTSISATTTSATLTGLTASTNYEFQVRSNCSATASAFSASTTFATATPAAACITADETANNASATAPTLTIGAVKNGGINTATDVDYYKFSNTAATKNIRITLTTLPADFDVTLYTVSSTGALTQVGASANGSTTSETIRYNGGVVGTYAVRVFGYNGALSTSVCYSLKAELSATNFREKDGITSDENTQVLNVISLYPNPAIDNATVTMEIGSETNATLQVLDMTGRVLVKEARNLNAGTSDWKFSTRELPTGIYIVNIQGENGLQTSRKLSVQH